MARLRLRQIALVATDLAGAERQITDRLGVELCFRDPGVGEFGLHNALFPIGEQLLEVVSPTRDGTTAGRFLERRGGDGGYMVILQTDEPLDDVRRRFADADARIVFEASVPGITGLHLHPRDVGGAIVSVDRAGEWPDWPWAGPDWRDHVVTDRVTAIRAVEIGADDPTAMTARWADVLGQPRPEGTTIELDDATELRFVPTGERGEGIETIELAAAAGATVGDHTIAGCHVRIT